MEIESATECPSCKQPVVSTVSEHLANEQASCYHACCKQDPHMISISKAELLKILIEDANLRKNFDQERKWLLPKLRDTERKLRDAELKLQYAESTSLLR